MPFTPRVQCAVNITAKDINGNSIAKQFNNVLAMNFDYAKGMINLVDDIQGSFYFQMPVTSLTYTIVSNVTPAVHTLILS